MNARTHGGPDAQGVPLLDFSTNANACGPCAQALAAVQSADASRYPDGSYADLRAQIAVFHGVDAQRIVIAGSASEFIFRFTAWAKARGMGSVSLPLHAYGDYAAAARAIGLDLVPESLASLAWACEPSSPLGAAHAGLQALAAADGTVVLDLAYEPLRLEGSLGLDAPGLDRVWQLWTPNKALGLCGVRGAYAIAPLQAAQAVGTLEGLAPSWVLGAHGVAMLQAWCDPGVQDWLRESRTVLRGWKVRQEEVLRSLGLQCLPSLANFITCSTGLAPEALAARLGVLRHRGIKLRDCASFGLSGHVRVGVQAPAAQDTLAAAWKENAGGRHDG